MRVDSVNIQYAIVAIAICFAILWAGSEADKYYKQQEIIRRV